MPVSQTFNNTCVCVRFPFTLLFNSLFPLSTPFTRNYSTLFSSLQLLTSRDNPVFHLQTSIKVDSRRSDRKKRNLDRQIVRFIFSFSFLLFIRSSIFEGQTSLWFSDLKRYRINIYKYDFKVYYWYRWKKNKI